MKQISIQRGALLLWLLSMSLSYLSAQSNPAQDKYWKYRKRFVEQMTVIGKSPGYSLPYSEVHPLHHDGRTSIQQNYWGGAPTVCPDPDEGVFVEPGTEPISNVDPPDAISWNNPTPTDPFDSNVVPGGDGTIRLGYYIATLATELYILNQQNEPIEAVAQELDFALEAFNRLDSLAETFYGLPGSVNGFFIRTDVPQHIFWDFRKNKLRWKDLRYDGLEYTVEGASYGHCRSSTLDITAGQVMSGDQCIHMLFGTSFVSKLVPATILGENGVSLKLKAQQIAHNIATYLDRMNWNIVDPDGISPPGNWGGKVGFFEEGINRAAEFICGTDIDPNASYLQATTDPLVKVKWDGIYEHYTTAPDHEQTISMSLISTSGAPPFFITNPAAAPAFHFMQYITGVAHSSHHEVYPLANAILHGNSLPFGIAQYSKFPINLPSPQFPFFPMGKNGFLNLMDQAPDEGICHTANPSLPCPNVKGWRGPNRWENPKNDFTPTSSAIGNGLDYMLLYNLYHIYYTLDDPYSNPYCSNFSYAFDYTTHDRRHYPKDNPSKSFALSKAALTGNIQFGTMVRNSEFSMFNPGALSNGTIVSTANLNILDLTGNAHTISNVTYNASREIKLRPGFKAVAGTKLVGKIVPSTIINTSIPSFKISGRDEICVNDDMNLAIVGGCFDPASVAWQVIGSPPGISLSSTTGNSVIVTAISPGSYLIKATAIGTNGVNLNWTHVLYVQSLDECFREPKGNLERNAAPVSLQASWHPNPTNGKLTLQLDHPTGEEELLVQIRDLKGRLIQERTLYVQHAGRESYMFNLREVPAGIYLVHVRGNSFTQTDKIVKQ